LLASSAGEFNGGKQFGRARGIRLTAVSDPEGLPIGGHNGSFPREDRIL
jgi:hypothetical protein